MLCKKLEFLLERAPEHLRPRSKQSQATQLVRGLRPLLLPPLLPLPLLLPLLLLLPPLRPLLVVVVVYWCVNGTCKVALPVECLREGVEWACACGVFNRD